MAQLNITLDSDTVKGLFLGHAPDALVPFGASKPRDQKTRACDSHLSEWRVCHSSYGGTPRSAERNLAQWKKVAGYDGVLEGANTEI